MQWYEILCLFFALSCIMGALVITCLFDYKYKLKKLEFEDKKYKDIECHLMHIYSIIDDIKNDIENKG